MHTRCVCVGVYSKQDAINRRSDLFVFLIRGRQGKGCDMLAAPSKLDCKEAISAATNS